MKMIILAATAAAATVAAGAKRVDDAWMWPAGAHCAVCVDPSTHVRLGS